MFFKKCEGLKKAKVQSDKIDKIFNSMDSDKSGNIEYTGYNYSLCILIQLEFLAASMDRKIYLKEEKLMASFQLFDKDGNGKISPEELQAILGRNFHFSKIFIKLEEGIYKDKPKEFWYDMIKCCDKDKDGCLNYEEFVDMMSH